MTMPASPLLHSLATLGLLAAAPVPAVRADEDAPRASRLFTASDFPRLARGIKLPRAGRYTLKVWTPSRQTWTLTADNQTLTLSAKVEGDDATPKWQTVGAAQLGTSEPVKIQVTRPAPKAADQPQAEAKKGEKAEAKKGDPKPVPIAEPAVLVLTTAPPARPRRGARPDPRAGRFG